MDGIGGLGLGLGLGFGGINTLGISATPMATGGSELTTPSTVVSLDSSSASSTKLYGTDLYDNIQSDGHNIKLISLNTGLTPYSVVDFIETQSEMDSNFKKLTDAAIVMLLLEALKQNKQ